MRRRTNPVVNPVAIVGDSVFGGAARRGEPAARADVLVHWRDHRGPAPVTLTPAQVPVVTKGNPTAVVEATSAATFSLPGGSSAAARNLRRVGRERPATSAAGPPCTSRSRSLVAVMARRLLAFVALVGRRRIGGRGIRASRPSKSACCLGGDVSRPRYSPLDQINATNFEKLRVAWTCRGDNFGPHRTPIPVDPHLRQRHALHGRRTAPHGRGDGSQDRGDRLDLPRAEHHTVGAVNAGRLRQGRRLRRDRRSWVIFYDLPRVLPARASTPRPGSRSRTGDVPCRCRAFRKAASSTC